MVGGSRSGPEGSLLPSIRRAGGFLRLWQGENITIGEKPEHRPCHSGANNWTGPHCQGRKGKKLIPSKNSQFRDVEAGKWGTSSASLLPSSIPMRRCRWSLPIISAQGSTGESKNISSSSIGHPLIFLQEISQDVVALKKSGCRIHHP